MAPTFVKDQKLALSDDRSCECQYLTLTDGQVRPAARDRSIERDLALCHVALQREQTCRSEGIVQDSVITLLERIEILTKGSTQELGLSFRSDTVTQA